MTKELKDWKPIFYTVYYPGFRDIAKKYGYALAVHGSVTRNMDLVAVPWIEDIGDYKEMLQEMREFTGVVHPDNILEGEVKPHGRIAYSILMGSGAFIDISVLTNS